MTGPEHVVTTLLRRMGEGDRAAAGEAMQAVYQELHQLAARYMRRESPDHTLQPTALVNEAYLRLAGGASDNAKDRQHFMAIAATVMRRILVDHAREKKAGKRGLGAQKVELESQHAIAAGGVEITELDELLTRLDAVDARAAKVVELRFFGGYTDEETAGVLRENVATIRRDWEFARSWLKSKLSLSRSSNDAATATNPPRSV